MGIPSVFEYSDYKDFLNAWLKDGDSEWGNITRLADAAGCQRSFLSRVLNGPVHLTPDHGYGLCEYWKLAKAEKEFFLTLLEISRSASRAYQDHLKSKLQTLKRENENLSTRVNRSLAQLGEKEMTYYSAWYWSAIHILVSIPGYQTVTPISQKLQLPEPTVQYVLELLEKFEFVRRHGLKWEFVASEIHVPRGSPLVSLHHGNWRQRAVLNSQSRIEDGVHFTVVQSVSVTAYEKIKQAMLDFIQRASLEAGPSKEEELVCIACDVFKV